MMTFATTNPATLRRWAISAVVVVLVHSTIVTAVVTWREATVPAEAPGPIVIELAPMPAAPTRQQAALPPAPEQVPPTASTDKTPEKVEQKPQEKTAARGEEKAGPSQFEDSPPAVPGGEASGAVQAGGGGVNPIDTRIGEQPRLRFKKGAKANDWTKAIMGRPSKSFAGRQQPLGPGTASGMARNAIGMLVQEPAGAMGIQGSTAANATKNAVGATAMNTVGGTAAVNGTATNAIGVNVPIRTRAPRTNIGQRGINPLASNATSSNASINGTSMIRPASATAVIGGPAKNVAGAINGTAMRPR